METREDFFEVNRSGWNDRADIHIKDETGFYDLENLRAGKSVLYPIETKELPGLTGKRIAHFQCHIGTDTLSLKIRGAASVCGLDFSPKAVAHARKLAGLCGIDAEFHEASVYDAYEALGGDYDMVFTTWGTLGWLDDLDKWAQAVTDVLKPGGQIYFADMHPFCLMLELDEGDRVVPMYDYDSLKQTPLRFEANVTYTESNEEVKSTVSYGWNHSVSKILGVLMARGFTLDFLHEHDCMPSRFLSILERHDDRMFRLPEGQPQFPLSWSFLMTKSV